MFSGSFDVLFLVVILIFLKKLHFLLHFFTFLKILDFTLIFMSRNPIVQKWLKINQFNCYMASQWLILKLNIRASNFTKKIGMSKNNLVVTLHQTSIMKICVPVFYPFLAVFLFFWMFPKTFGQCVIHGWKALPMTLQMLPSPSF